MLDRIIRRGFVTIRRIFSRVLWALLLLVSWQLGTVQAAAAPTTQTAPSITDLAADREPIALLQGNWRFHPGDDPRWSAPHFDDSAWATLQPTTDWNAQGYSERDNFAWLRFQVRVPPHTSSFVLWLPTFPKNYQLFVDGRLIGQVGDFRPGKQHPLTRAVRVFTVPVPESQEPELVTVALRLWQVPWLVGVGQNILDSPPSAGESSTVLDQFSTTKDAALLQTGSEYTLNVVGLIAALASLFLFWFSRQRVYLWFAGFGVLGGGEEALDLLSRHFAWPTLLTLYLWIAFDVWGQVTLGYFILGILGVRPRWPRFVLIAAAFFSQAGTLLVMYGYAGELTSDVIYFVGALTIILLLLFFLVQGWRTGAADAKLLLVAYLIDCSIAFLDNLGHLLQDLHGPHAAALITSNIIVLHRPFTVGLPDIGNMASLLGFLAVLVLRFGRTSRDQQRLATALQSAHDVQYGLVPSDLPVFGSLRAEIAYLAAEEVGGDFCQILQRPDGSVLAAIGDVSGKGLQAAMLGTLAVGALRSLADEVLPPAAILERLNAVVLRTAYSGFITCLCVILDEDGNALVANAGHLSPYLDGHEVPVEPGLPLGIVADAGYEETALTLPPGARLTLLSDGVIEARSPRGELFGFERTSRISRLPAAEIAAKARDHGQEDDITIVTLDWLAPAAATVA